MTRGILSPISHHRPTLLGWWRRLKGEQRAGVVFACIEAALVGFLVVMAVVR